MSLIKRVFLGASWLALFKTLGQAVSWTVTIYVARILSPDDYGLMAMATIMTGYAGIFNELGLGAAIIQRQETTKEDLSSIFWFSLGVSTTLALCCIPLSYLTAALVHEPRVIPIAQAVGGLFILSGLQIIPLNLIKKKLDFKFIGAMGLVSTFCSCSCMAIMAKMGAGVWTLLSGNIVSAAVNLVFVYARSGWRPMFYFDFGAAKSYIKFGVTNSLGGSLFYVWKKSDTFFAGRAWNANNLGYYSFALQLAQIPTDKIVSIINQVSYPALSKLQSNSAAFNAFYLNITKATMCVVLPLFLGGFLVGEDIIRLLLPEKWYPMVEVFRLLCLAQIITSLCANNSYVHLSKNRPHWILWNQCVFAVVMPTSFFFAVSFGLKGLVVPWLSVYVVLKLGWLIITLHSIGVSLSRYLDNLLHPVLGSLVMLVCVGLFQNMWGHTPYGDMGVVRLFFSAVFGGSSYMIYYTLFDKDYIAKLKSIRSSSFL